MALIDFPSWLKMSPEEKAQARAEGRAPTSFATDPGPMPEGPQASASTTAPQPAPTAPEPGTDDDIDDAVSDTQKKLFFKERALRFEDYNRRFAKIAVGSTVVVMELEEDRSIKSLWPFPEFHKLKIKDRIKAPGSKRARQLSDVWLRSNDGREYDRLVYDMPGGRVRAGKKDFNGYQGFTVEPKTGDWSKNRAHMLDVICGGHEDRFAWLFNWSAGIFQFPGRHAGSAVVLQGKQGTGKGHFANDTLGLCFHPQQYLHVIGADQLTEKFNEHFSGKVLVFGDESAWGGDKKAAEKLKGLITEPTILIHRKFLSAVEEPSALHIIMSSNSDWPVAIPADDRRFFVVDVSEARRQDYEYFAALRYELEHGGRAAMLHDMLRHQVDEKMLRQPLETGAKRDVKERTFKPEEIFLQNWLVNMNGAWTPRVSKQVLYDQYCSGLPRNAQPLAHLSFGKLLNKYGIEWKDCKLDVVGDAGQSDRRRVNGYKFLRSLSGCRQAFDAVMGMQSDWPQDPDDGASGQAGDDRDPGPTSGSPGSGPTVEEQPGQPSEPFP